MGTNGLKSTDGKYTEGLWTQLNIQDMILKVPTEVLALIFISMKYSFNPLTTNVPHHIETSQLICHANEVTGFYMIGNIGR